MPLGGAPAIRYALSALKGAGEGQMEAIVKARGGTPFAGLDDFARRVSPRDVNKKALETLVAAGAFDTIEADRAKVFAATEAMLALANRTADELLAVVPHATSRADLLELAWRVRQVGLPVRGVVYVRPRRLSARLPSRDAGARRRRSRLRRSPSLVTP